MGSNQEQIRVGLIGTGGVGEKLLQTFQQHLDTEVRAICDVNVARAAALAAEAGDCAYYSDYRQLLQREDLDLIYLGVPPKLHHQIALEVIQGKRHIFCEKPLANSLAEAEEMYEAATKAGIVHAMNFPTYYRKAWQELAARIKQGTIGEIRRIEVQAYFHQWPRAWQQNSWIAGREQGGFIREVMPHYIHLTHSLFGSIVRVDSHVRYPADQNACETDLIASLELEDGTPVLLSATSQIAHKEYIAYTVYGTEGTVSLVNWAQLEAGGIQETPTKVEVPAHNHLLQEVSEIVQAIRGEKADIIDFGAGLRVQQVLEQLLEKEKAR